MEKASPVTGSGVHGYLTLKLPPTVDDGNAAKIWSVADVGLFCLEPFH